jgi:hypothetical protein
VWFGSATGWRMHEAVTPKPNGYLLTCLGRLRNDRCGTLTLKSIRARPVVLKLKRPVVARIATLTEWP